MQKKKYTTDVHDMVSKLWKDAKVQDAFTNNRYEYHIFDGAEYFFDQFDRLQPPKYVQPVMTFSVAEERLQDSSKQVLSMNQSSSPSMTLEVKDLKERNGQIFMREVKVSFTLLVSPSMIKSAMRMTLQTE